LSLLIPASCGVFAGVCPKCRRCQQPNASGPPERYVLPHARFLIHQPHLTGGLEGQASDIEIHAREIVRQKEEMNHILASHTGQDFETVVRDTDRDRWLTAEQAVGYGIVDAVMAPSRVPDALISGS
jgi:ATP-dependent Clp protease protease subunit